MHQRPRRRARRVFRRAQRSARRSAAERTARGRRLELRGGARVGALVVPHDDLRARRTARVRAGVRRHAGGDGRAEARRRSISSSVACSGGCRPARSSTRAWTQFAFPPLWHYDVLRALDYLRAAGVRRMRESRRRSRSCSSGARATGAGCSTCDTATRLHEELAGAVGAPNRWITLRALPSAGLVRTSRPNER